MYKNTLAPDSIVPSNPRVEEHVITGVAVCVALLQLLTVTELLVKHCDSPVACALAVITSLSAKPETAIVHVLPEATVVVPIEMPLLNNVIVAV